ncbi:MAG: hypothetical protein SNJ82_07865 [Gemmataceae bacterium]
MKKFLAAMLAAAFLLPLTIGCGDSPAPAKDKKPATTDKKEEKDKKESEKK